MIILQILAGIAIVAIALIGAVAFDYYVINKGKRISPPTDFDLH